MNRRLLKGMLALGGLSLCGLLMGAAASSDNAPPPPGKTTFYRDVLPILQNNCQSCHRPGEVAPMSLLTYEQSRPWAKAIKEKVLARKKSKRLSVGLTAARWREKRQTHRRQENSSMAGTSENRTR